MSVSTEVQELINTSLAENNKALLAQISKLVREIKKLRREEPKSFKRKGNEIQYKFNSKLQDSLDEATSHLETGNAVEKAKASLSEGTSMLNERQKLILLADKSEFG